jgi:hypothetical protein
MAHPLECFDKMPVPLLNRTPRAKQRRVIGLGPAIDVFFWATRSHRGKRCSDLVARFGKARVLLIIAIPPLETLLRDAKLENRGPDALSNIDFRGPNGQPYHNFSLIWCSYQGCRVTHHICGGQEA